MDPVWNVVTVATETVAFNVVMRIWGRVGLVWSIDEIQTGMMAMQTEITKLVDVLRQVADMNGSIRVAEQRQIETDRPRYSA